MVDQPADAASARPFGLFLAVGAIVGSAVGALAGLVIGCLVFVPTALFAAAELGVAGGLVGILLGLAAEATVFLGRMLRRSAIRLRRP